MGRGDFTSTFFAAIAMGILLLLAYGFRPEGATSAPNDNYKILRVIDGDTVEFEAPFLPEGIPPKMSLRLKGIDTPESKHRAKCAKERAMAESARAFVEQMIKVAKRVKITFEGWDKYGGRVLGYIEVDGQNLADRLIAQGLAAPYTGQGPKRDWCA